MAVRLAVGEEAIASIEQGRRSLLVRLGLEQAWNELGRLRLQLPTSG
ncbi:hypothetical protein ACFYX5_24770 [Streptomyces rubiginosohelvolus]